MYKPAQEQYWNEKATNLRKTRLRGVKEDLKQQLSKKKPTSLYNKAKTIESLRGEVDSPSPTNRYKIVPPVKGKKALHKSTKRQPATYYEKEEEEEEEEEDSWGEASEGSDAEYYHPHNQTAKKRTQKSNFPLPPMSFALLPVPYPGSLGYKSEAPKQPRRKHKKPTQRVKIPVKHEIETQTEDFESPQPLREQTIPNTYVYQSFTPEPTQHHPPYLSEPEYTLDPRYPYIRVMKPRSPLLPEQELLTKAASAFREERYFAERFTADFIDTEIKEQIIPDLLIEVLNEMFVQAKPSLVQHSIAVPIQPRIESNLRRISPPPPPRVRIQEKEPLTPTLRTQAELSKEITLGMLDDMVQSESYNIVKEVTSEFVNDYMKDTMIRDNVEGLVDELSDEFIRYEFDNVLKESSNELTYEDGILDPVLNAMIHEIAEESIQHYDDKLQQVQLDEISQSANKKILDSMMLDHLLTQLIRQSEVLVDSETSLFEMDSMILDVLLQRMIEIDYSQTNALSVKPVKRYQENIVTVIALDTLLNELCLGLDEDMKDYDEYECDLADLLDSKDPNRQTPASIW